MVQSVAGRRVLLGHREVPLARHVSRPSGRGVHRPRDPLLPAERVVDAEPVRSRPRDLLATDRANEYDDGTLIQATFAYGNDGWGFAMLHDEQGTFHCTTDVEVTATVRPNGYPETVNYRFLGRSWTWQIDPQGERARTIPGAPLGADGTCTRDGDDRKVRYSMGNSDWWTDGRADRIIRSS